MTPTRAHSITWFYIDLACVCLCTWVCVSHRGQRTVFWSWFSPSTFLWVPGVHLRLPDLRRRHLPPPRMSFKKNNSSWRCSNRHHRIQDFFVCSLYFGRLISKMELSSGRFFLNSAPSRYSHAMRWVETKVHSLNKCIQKWLRIWFMALCYFNTRYVLCSRYLPFPLLQVFSASSFSSDGFAFWFTDKIWRQREVKGHFLSASHKASATHSSLPLPLFHPGLMMNTLPFMILQG